MENLMCEKNLIAKKKTCELVATVSKHILLSQKFPKIKSFFILQKIKIRAKISDLPTTR